MFINSSNIVIKAIETLNTTSYKTGTYTALSASGTIHNGDEEDAYYTVSNSTTHTIFTNDCDKELVISLGVTDYKLNNFNYSSSTAYYQNKEGNWESLPTNVLKVLYPGMSIKVSVKTIYGNLVKAGNTVNLNGGGGTCSYTIYNTTWENP